MDLVQDVIDMIRELRGVQTGAWVISRPVILPGYENHGYVAVGQVTQLEARGGITLVTVAAQNDDARQLSFEDHEVTAISLLEAMALVDLKPDSEVLRRRSYES